MEQTCPTADRPLGENRGNEELRRSFGSLRLQWGESEEDLPQMAQGTSKDPELKTEHAHARPEVSSLPYQLRPVSTAVPAGTPVNASTADKWREYAQPLKVAGQPAQYVCTWPFTDGRVHNSQCGYSSKRHLVKRHIESKHLQLR